MIIYTTLSVITQHSHILWPLHRNPIETENYQFEVIIHALPLQNFCSFAVCSCIFAPQFFANLS